MACLPLGQQSSACQPLIPKGSVMKKWIVMCAILGAAAQSNAEVGSWTKQTMHYPIYFSGDSATMPFYASPPMLTGKSFVTSVSWNWTGYENGNTSRLVQICYSTKYSMALVGCQNISRSPQGSINAFNGLDASSRFWIRHQLFEGSYPAMSYTSDTITVMYK